MSACRRSTRRSYHYSYNDPLNKQDPLGLRPDECAFGEDPEACSEIVRILNRYISDWRSIPTVIKAVNCGGDTADRTNGITTPGELCASKKALHWNWDNYVKSGETVNIYKRTSPNVDVAFEHVVVHEYGHIVFFNVYEENVRNGWPARDDTLGWCDLFNDTRNSIGAPRCGSGLVTVGTFAADEFMADCLAQGWKPDVAGAYWIRHLPQFGSGGCPQRMIDMAREYRNKKSLK